MPSGASRSAKRAVGARHSQEESEPVGPSKDAGAPVAIYVDLVPSLPPGDAFAEYLAGQPGRYSRAIRLHLARREPIRPEAADILVADLGERMGGATPE